MLWSPQPGDPDHETAPECILELPACPESPLVSGQYMRLSVPPAGLAAQFPDLAALYPDAIEYPMIPGMNRYPDFCEERVLDPDPAYSACLAMTGFVVAQYTDGGQNGCRLLHPIKCPVGLYMGSSKTCRAVQRRNWTCQAGDIPRNQFNTCYHPQAAAPHPHPACGPGSPDFVAMPCEDYVGSDFLTNAPDVNCTTTYVTGTPVQYPAGNTALPGAPAVRMQPSYSTGAASVHWCSYDTRFLDAACHRTNISPSKCATPSLALCVKRASQTGGCDAIADTIRCRAYEAAYRQQGEAVPLEEVRVNGCTPCVILPFRRVPARCPRDTRARPRPGRSSGLRNDYPASPDLLAILREEADFAIIDTRCGPVRRRGETLADHSECARLAVCTDPPNGAIAWEPTHVSGVAVVNMPVIVTVTDIRMSEHFDPRHFHHITTDPDEPPISFSQGRRRVEYEGDTSEDPRVRTLADIDPSATLASPDQIPSGTTTTPGGECVLTEAPRFELVVQELWPDNGPDYNDNDPDCVVPSGGARPGSDAQTITELFGRDSLRWWCDLTEAERRRRTLARGLEWWDDPTTDQAGRIEKLTEEVDCDYHTDGTVIWCRWVPTRPGYYRLHAGGAWYLNRYYDRVPAGGRLTEVLDYLNDPTDGAANRQQLQQQLNGIGRTPADIGLDPSLTAALPSPSTPDWMYSETLAPLTNCPSIDLRIYCGSTATGNYTETEPIGVMVHEMRVSTVTPSR